MACKSGTLYTYPQNFRAQKCLITAKYSKVDLKIAPDFVFGESNTEASFLKKFPSGKVPAFESSEGVTLTESNAIAYLIASEELRGKTPVERAQIQQWLDFTDSNILPPALTWVFPCLGAMAYNKKSMDRAKEDVGKALKVLNDHFLLHTYLVGERISLADISLTCSILSLYVHVMDPEFRY
uniref:Elongation factor 1-gamma n=1 Tax=Lepeophtheirus salmonis TaxID=72036 RepID=A0A0K2UD26_LEPSM